ncbi:gamma-glutamyltransferase family protein [Polynucleobacter sp. AP-Titi-500A-B4]|uniref:gamma-glutamyltransferase family protein n=1 Tax=Polynucleobacter sp. AP-Titi-500A-B4 TaxID=2576923 RepID=UPI001BFE6D22|nr:gamma-glutamyltransferase family protein [Polynucleobacter sp. AP-Titi-500A-B4]QWE11974.1 gamma-glutamyltransferase family protein [Polynucleobacter sp. AP-Titi-500A-B4]
MKFNWNNPYPTIRLPVMGRNVVSTSHPYAAQAGLKIIQQGGNAIDAAIAAAAALMIVEPVSNGLGSDCFAIVWDGQQLHGLNSSGTAPQAWSPEYFGDKYGLNHLGLANNPKRGWDSVTVPGALAGWEQLHSRFGSLPLADLLQPAIEIAERGYAMAPVVAHKWAAAIPELHHQPGFAQAFMPYGRAPDIGEMFRFDAAAKTLKAIAKNGIRDFYEGEIAQAIVDHAGSHGGSMSLNDLADYRPDWVGTIEQSMKGADGKIYSMHEIPPNGQGIGALIALGILQNFDLTNYPVDSVESQHLQIEAMKLAFADVYQYVADPRSMDVTPEQMLDSSYLAERAKLINPNRATHFKFGLPQSGGTIYLSATDEQGRMISFIQSNYMGFGSGVVIPDWGVSLQNRGFGFSMDPKSANVVAGGKRPFHTIIPAFLTRQEDGQTLPQMSFGLMGGDMQPQGHLQTILRMISYRQQPQAACDAPRWKVNRDFTLDVESNMNPSTIQGLSKLGHELKKVDDPYMDFGSGQFIWRLSDDIRDGYVAASDPRRDGQAAVY